MGFSLFDFYDFKLSVKMVYDGFGGFRVFSYIWSIFQQQLVPGKYQWGCLPLSKSNMSTQYLVTQAPPYHCNIPALKGTSGSHLVPAPTTSKSAFETSTDIHHCSHQTSYPGSPDMEFTGRGVFQVLNTSWHS